MAKVGLKFDKVDITDKRYLDITPALKIDDVYKLFAQRIAKKNAPAPKPDQGKAKE